MTGPHGLKHDPETEIERGLIRLGEQMRSVSSLSPLWRASVYWIGRAYKELEDRHRAEWGNCAGFMSSDYGDEITT